MKRLFRLPKTIILGLIRNPQLTSAIGIFCLIFLIWFGGARLGLGALEDRLFMIIAVFFLWVMVLLFGKSRESRDGKYLESALNEQANAQMLATRPDRKEEIKTLKNELDKAIFALKHSKLGKGHRGTAALYALPWYMMIGPSASGKSTALLNSGLHFPYLGTTGRGVQGIGGTRNCDWWFTSEAILLDTAGRYVSEEDDREEWFGFLDMLKKARKQKPINGVLATMSVADLLQADEEEVEGLARDMRERIDELTERLGISFPVYLLFTKCDLVQGFVEFFEDLGKTDRDQIWGCTLPQKTNSGIAAALAFSDEFSSLCEALNSRRMARLSTARGGQKVRDVYAFPLQFAAGREKFNRFVDILFKENPYRDNPTFRGFYFTSGTQEGRPIDQILKAVSESSGFPASLSDTFDTETEPKSYFIKNLFQEVIFPDQHLAGVSSAMTHQRGLLRVATFAAAILFSLGSVSALVFSFLGNKTMTSQLRAEAFDAAQMVVSDPQQLTSNMVLLEGLRQRLNTLQSYETEGIPLRLRLGLYQGETLLPALRTLYFNRFNALIGDAVVDELKSKLRFFTRRRALVPERLKEKASNNEANYEQLKTYLMLAEPDYIDTTALSAWYKKTVQTPGVITEGRQPLSQELQTLALKQVEFYIAQLAAGQAYAIDIDKPLVQAVRNRLLKTAVGARLYTDIKKQGALDLPYYALNDAMESVPQNFVESSFQIPGFFTKVGWQQFPKVMEKVLKGSSGEVVRVLGLQDVKQEDLMVDVERRYFEEYVRYWQRFLESIRLNPVKNLFDVEDKLSTLTQAHSPLRKLLASVDQNTYLFARGESEMLSGASAFVSGATDKVKRALSLGDEETEALAPLNEGPQNPVSRKFQSLHQFMNANTKTDQIALIQQYVAEVGKAHNVVWGVIHQEETGIEATTVAKQILNRGENELIQGARNTEKLLKQLQPASRAVLSPLFLAPFRMAAEGIMQQATRDLDRHWREEVYLPCRQNVMDRYPFAQKGEDASMDDLAAILQPQRGLFWTYYEKEIKPFIDMKQNGFVPKKRMFGVSIQFSSRFLEGLQRARLLSDSLFEKGSAMPSFRFELYPIPSPGVSESIFVMDGTDLKYRNEPQDWYDFSWPGEAGPAGASLQIKSETARQRRNFEGRWGLFKLLDQGEIIQINATRYKVSWQFKQRPDNTIIKIEYDLRTASRLNPLQPGLFRNFSCVEKMGR